MACQTICRSCWSHITKKDHLASHDLLNDIQRAFVKSKANILHENKSIKLNSMLVRQIINEGIEELIWSEGFNPGDTDDFEKYLMTRFKNEKKSLSKKSMLEESALGGICPIYFIFDEQHTRPRCLGGRHNFRQWQWCYFVFLFSNLLKHERYCLVY